MTSGLLTNTMPGKKKRADFATFYADRATFITKPMTSGEVVTQHLKISRDLTACMLTRGAPLIARVSTRMNIRLGRDHVS
jgi:hypothetical protein